MGIFKVCLIAFFWAAALWASSGSDSKHHALYRMQNADIESAILEYQRSFAESGRHDFEVLQRMGLVLFQHGIHSDDPAIFTMTLFGAGLSGAAGALDILEKGLSHPDPQVQMIALHFIAKIEDDQTDELLNRAMRSDFLSTRMEAAFYMAQKKHPRAVGQIEGLMVRLPPIFKPLFPSLFALIGTSDATASLKRLLDDIDPQVRIESILNIARLGRDDLLPLLRKRLTHCNVSELEACAFAMGALKDSSSINRLKKLARSSSDNVKIAAILALQELGDRSCVAILEEMAREPVAKLQFGPKSALASPDSISCKEPMPSSDMSLCEKIEPALQSSNLDCEASVTTGSRGLNVYAISALGMITGTEETLAPLALSKDLSIRINAGIALLLRRDARCLNALEDILIADARDLAFYPMPSVGRTMAVWKAVPSAELRSKDPTIDLSLSLSMREQILRETIYLPPDAFFQLARRIMERQQNDLIPCLISLLQDLRTTEAIDVLKEGCAQWMAPLVRDYCHLALFNLKEEGPYSDHIKHWIMHQKDAELIRLRPMLPWKMRLDGDYTVTPEETSRLLVESFLAVASDRNIDFLVDAILRGNPQNRYALFGLLMRATE
ncbi:MAG: hypothetical protein HW387_1472 [Parachlamydiales bacterium]|nr:hypothetical protein [Parachlamydiales bacterium]